VDTINASEAIDQLISRRASQDRRPDPDELEPGYMESVRRFKERRRREVRAAWYGWHLDQAERHRRTLEDLIDHHETQAARLCEDEGRPGA
jgi:hypothetical protein